MELLLGRKGGGILVKQILLRPMLLEYCRTHLIFTAAGALFTVLMGVIIILSGMGEAIVSALPTEWTNATKTVVAALPILLPLVLCLAAYVPAGRMVRRRNGWERPEVDDALIILLVPAVAFWILAGLGSFVPHGHGLIIAAALLNSPAYGLFVLFSLLTGWGIAAPDWTGYVGILASGLLPPLLYLIGSYLPIAALDEVEEERVGQ